MIHSWLSRIGDWNPQLFRELKGRFRLRNIIPVAAIAILVQLLVIGAFWLQLPTPISLLSSEVTTYPKVSLESPFQADRRPFIRHIEYFSPPPVLFNRNHIASLPEVVNLKEQDVLVAIDGEPIPFDNGEGVNIYDLEQKLDGQRQPGVSLNSPEDYRAVVDTPVTLTVQRPSDPELGEFEVQLQRVLRSTTYSPYCLQPEVNSSPYYGNSRCELIQPNSLEYAIDWQRWYADLFYVYSWIISVGLLVVGIFMLASNLEYENQVGTLNFIRLSPLASGRVFVGKILGVPSLLYLAALLFLPGQHWAGLQAGLSLGVLLLNDLVLVLGLGFWYSLSLVSSLLVPWRSGLQPWLWSILAFICALVPLSSTYGPELADLFDLFAPTTLMINLHGAAIYSAEQVREAGTSGWNDTGYLWQIGAITGGNLLWFGGWMWTALNRRFQSPTATPLSKVQSYLFVIGIEVAAVTTATVLIEHSDFRFIFLMLTNLVMAFGLMVALAGQRQPLIDWARFRHRQRQSSADSSSDSFTMPARDRASIWPDLLWGDRSPSTLAFAVNLGIATLFTFGWQAWYAIAVNTSDSLFFSGMQILHGLGAVFALAIFVQLIMLWRRHSRAVWATAFVAINLVLPIVAGALLQTTLPLLWVFSPLGWVDDSATFYSIALEFSLAAQALTIVLGGFWLRRSLHQLGTSELKELTEAP